MRANKRTDEQVTQYLRPNSWLFYPTVRRAASDIACRRYHGSQGHCHHPQIAAYYYRADTVVTLSTPKIYFPAKSPPPLFVLRSRFVEG